MKGNYKVLFLTSSLSNGGAERQLSLLIKYLPGSWAAKLWSSGDGPFSKALREMGVNLTIDPRKSRFDLAPFFRMWQFIRAERPDIVHTWGWMSAFTAGPICKALKIPMVDGTIRSGMKLSFLSRLASGWSDRVIANSRAGLIASGIDPQRVRVVYNGFDPNRLKLCQSSDEPSPERTIVVMTARMVREKDYASFLSAARALNDQTLKTWQFWAIGNGTNRESLISSSGDLVRSGCLAFPDAGIEVMPYVRQAAVGVLLSNPQYAAEGISNSIMEYMACGLPVICYKNGGNEELVIDGETGFVINPGDVNTLVERLLYLQQNPEAAKIMGRSGKERLLKNFSVEKMVNDVISVYQEVLPKE